MGPAAAFPYARMLEVARAAVDAAGAAALLHWRNLRGVERKADGSVVTQADRDAEKAAVAVIERAFPSHDVLGEEGGPRGRGGPTRWIVDPLDGTSGFARGGSMWGPIVACEHEGAVVAGAMSLPVQRLTYAAAKGLGCWRGADRLRVSSTEHWPDAVVSLGGLYRLLYEGPRGHEVVGLLRSAASARAYGDLAACAMLLDGVADVWIEDGVKVWDVAAPQILVEEAGGIFTDFSGVASPEAGEAIAGNAAMHAHVLAALGVRRPS